MPLASGAERVEIRDADTIKTRPIDTTRCEAVGQIDVGPVEANNFDVAVKNATAARGGNLFFGTAFGGNYYGTRTVSGMVYRCPDGQAQR